MTKLEECIASDDDRVAGIVADTTCFGEYFQQRYIGIGFIDHGVQDRSHNGDRPALVFFNNQVDFRVTDQSVCLQDIRDHLFGLGLCESGNMQTRGNQRHADRACLAHANVSRQFRNIEHRNTQKVATSYSVLMRRQF